MSARKPKATRSSLNKTPNSALADVVSKYGGDGNAFSEPDFINRISKTNKEDKIIEEAPSPPPQVEDVEQDSDDNDVASERSTRQRDKRKRNSGRPRLMKTIYKPFAREGEKYRVYSCTMTDAQYDAITEIRLDEMARLKRNISMAQVIRVLLQRGLENSHDTKMFDDGHDD